MTVTVFPAVLNHVTTRDETILGPEGAWVGSKDWGVTTPLVAEKPPPFWGDSSENVCGRV